MAKDKTIYRCQNCGATAAKWRGKCPSCGEWNTYLEEVIPGKQDSRTKAVSVESNSKAESLAEFDMVAMNRLDVLDSELNRVLGGGLVPGSMVLVGGEPGIGKSTLLLQLALNLKNLKLLYVSGEESINQIKMRASRIGDPNPNCYLLPETTVEVIGRQVKEIDPDILIIDSIQTLHTNEVDSTAGSVPQIRESTGSLQRLAKTRSLPVFIVGHITKDGFIAGPKLLEHMVDVVLYFEGDQNYNYRILRSIKNRFGSVAEIGIYEMVNKGLRIVTNPSEILLSQRDENLSGIAIAAMLEGLRPLLIEIQALVSPSYYGTPQRSTTGFDQRRLNMLLAVLEKRCGLKLSTNDVFLNIAGGLKVEDTSIDLSVAVAVASSYHDHPVQEEIAFSGEVGLSGEIRPVQQVDLRIAEAAKLGFKKIFVSSFNAKTLLERSYGIEVRAVENIGQVLNSLF